ncbi:hypothetical protein B4100_0151 [Heyndrickxia coagulans]|nr:hypothetical protein B4100_0151 [Heyndrickxia coagulans]
MVQNKAAKGLRKIGGKGARHKTLRLFILSSAFTLPRTRF